MDEDNPKTYRDSGYDELLRRDHKPPIETIEADLSSDSPSSRTNNPEIYNSKDRKTKMDLLYGQLTFSDGARQRVLLGNLGKTGNYGIRVLDALGNIRLEVSNDRNFSDIEGRRITVGTEGDDFTNISDGINYMNEQGGGTVFIKSGTYVLDTSIQLYSNIRLVGEDKNSTIIDFNGNDARVFAVGGTEEYKEGTVEVSDGTNTIIGTGTSWLSISSANSILVDGVLYTIASIDSDTQLTITENYNGQSFSSISYVIATFIHNIEVSNLWLKNTAGNESKGIIDFSYVENALVKNCIVSNFTSGTYGDGIHFVRCISSLIAFSEINHNVANGIELDSGQNCTIDSCLIHDNETIGIYLNSLLGLGTKNVVRNCIVGHNGYIGIFVRSGKNIVIGNLIFRNKSYGLWLQHEENVVGQNTIEQNLDNGIGMGLNASYNTVVGNYVSFNQGNQIALLSSSIVHNIVASNNLRTYSTASVPVGVTNHGNINFISNNIGDTLVATKTYIKAVNYSGGALTAGELVTIVPVAAQSSRFTTSTSAGTNLILGMLAENTASLDVGYIQTSGYTTLMKVNGTTDIAVGDFISNSTVAGIGKKASAGETAIAIAYEAYTTDDSNGVINAMIISPRLI